MIRTLMAASALAGSLFAPAGAARAATPSPFKGETVFGDSLSDGGDLSIYAGLPSIMRFTTNPGLTTVEDVAAFYGLALTPSLEGGTNFAYGGAGVNSNAPFTPAGVPTVTQQVAGYLAANRQLSASELYTVFGGANDIFYHETAAAAATFIASHSAGDTATQLAVLTALVDGAEGVSNPESQATATAAIQAAAAQELTLIGSLQKAGAHYVVVFNLPDIGRTPSAVTDDALVPGTKAALTAASSAFNTVLNAGLKTASVGIIPVNTFALLNEVLANPTAYGYVNSTDAACTTTSSLNCTRATLKTPTAYANYVFADGVHPTTYTHSLFAQVVENEIIAPQQISLLAEEPLATLEAERNVIGQQLLSDQLGPSMGIRLFATGGYVRQHIGAEAYTSAVHDDDGLITVGVDDRLTPEVTLGGELSGGTSSEKTDGQLHKFQTDAILGSIFAQYVRGPAYVSGAAGYGDLHVHDIQRLFKIGPVTRTENGGVDGETSSVNAIAGYWLGASTLRAGPFVTGAYERVHLDQYNEDGGDSGAMSFGPQTRESLIGEAGLRIQGMFALNTMQLRPYAEVGYAYDADARTRDVVAGLTTMNGQFAIPGFSPDRQWGEVQAGLNAAITTHWSGYIAYNGRFAGATTDDYGGNIGVEYAF